MFPLKYISYRIGVSICLALTVFVCLCVCLRESIHQPETSNRMRNKFIFLEAKLLRLACKYFCIKNHPLSN